MKIQSTKNIYDIFDEKIKILSEFEKNYPENPDDLITSSIEYGKNGYDIYLEISNDEKLHGIERIIRRSILSTPFDVQYKNERDNNENITSFIKENLEQLEENTFKSVLNNLLDARIFGFKICEKVFKIQNSKIFIKHLKSLPCDYFDFQTDSFGNMENVIVYTNNKSSKIHIPKDDFFNKFIIFTYPYKKDGNYYGQSAYKCLYEVWRKKKRLSLMAPIAYELRFIPPIKTVYDRSLKAGEAGIKDVAKNIKNNSHINIPALRNEDGKLEPIADIEFLSGGDADFNSIIKQIEAYNIDMSRSLGLPDDLGYSTTSNGSNAKAKTQLELFYDLIVDEQNNLENIISEQLVKQLVKINFGEQKSYPKFRFIRNNYDDMITRVEYIAKLKAANLNVKEDWIESFLDIPLERENYHNNILNPNNYTVSKKNEVKEEVISKILKGYLPRIENVLKKYFLNDTPTIQLQNEAAKNASDYVFGIIIRSYLEGLKFAGVNETGINKSEHLDLITKTLSLNTKAIKVFREYLNLGVFPDKSHINNIRQAKDQILGTTLLKLSEITKAVNENSFTNDKKDDANTDSKSYIKSREYFIKKSLESFIKHASSSYFDLAVKNHGENNDNKK